MPPRLWPEYESSAGFNDWVSSERLPVTAEVATRANCELSMTCCRKLSRVAKRFARLRRFQPENSELKSEASHLPSGAHSFCPALKQNWSGVSPGTGEGLQ